MKVLLIFIAAYALNCEGAVIVSDKKRNVLNNRPIIGILSQEQSFYLHSKYVEENYTSYIAASYVKDVESAGARVVPILIGKDRSYYEDLMSKINGVLLPGGATFFNQSNGYADAGQHIYEIAQKFNDAGDYFPIFGICLGFELLIILASGRGKEENRIRCYSYSNIPLNFTHDYRNSKMFKETPSDIIEILKTENVTVNAHQFCIVDENLKSHNLTHDWLVTSHSNDDHSLEFIASVEHKREYIRQPALEQRGGLSSDPSPIWGKRPMPNSGILQAETYPFYGIQFHPEKSAFEWKLSKKYAHSFEAIKANRYFMDFFVQECRKSQHSFARASEENRYLIYNYAPRFTGVLGSAYHQCYFFEPRGTVSK